MLFKIIITNDESMSLEKIENPMGIYNFLILTERDLKVPLSFNKKIEISELIN